LMDPWSGHQLSQGALPREKSYTHIPASKIWNMKRIS
jgi:hypothetical protein